LPDEEMKAHHQDEDKPIRKCTPFRFPTDVIDDEDSESEQPIDNNVEMANEEVEKEPSPYDEENEESFEEELEEEVNKETHVYGETDSW
jgi:hypothetical protein